MQQKNSQIPLRGILLELQNKTFIQRLRCIYISVFTTELNLKCVLQIKHIAKRVFQTHGLSQWSFRHCMYKTAVEESPKYPILYKSLLQPEGYKSGEYL